MLTCQLSFEFVYCVTFRRGKATILNKCWYFGGFCTQPPLPMRTKLGMLEKTYDLHLCSKFRLEMFILSHSGGEKPKSCRFWNSAFCDVANRLCAEKVEHRCTNTNLPLSNGVKIVSILHRLQSKIVRINSNIHKHDITSTIDKQAHRQTTKQNSTLFAAPSTPCQI